ncbi:MAG: hypothetical protein JWQ89_2226 [Devosia sp.]|uniref:hypothetical protein n=1 Tax=Devosia sp. TaxID=1871048 RepID=UPI0026176084|nr:hypothetical protein [Devosia sp.]MDB5540499.1 hypothetical protein [Devosia sp.]
MAGRSVERRVSDAAALAWLNEIKARPNRTPAEEALVEEIDAAWREAAARDQTKQG